MRTITGLKEVFMADKLFGDLKSLEGVRDELKLQMHLLDEETKQKLRGGLTDIELEGNDFEDPSVILVTFS